jgi:hypothetical protein
VKVAFGAKVEGNLRLTKQ